jgi:hypothetical protein
MVKPILVGGEFPDTGSPAERQAPRSPATV